MMIQPHISIVKVIVLPGIRSVSQIKSLSGPRTVNAVLNLIHYGSVISDHVTF